MIKINLLLEKKETTSNEPIFIELAVFGVSVAIAIVVCYLLGISIDVRIKNLDNEIATKTQQFQELRKVILEVDSVKTEIDNMQAKLNSVKSIIQDRMYAVKFIDKITEVLPQEVVLKSLVKSGVDVQIVGNVPDPVNVSDLLDTLKSAPYFSNVQLGDIKFLENDTLGKAEFNISFKISNLN